MIQGLLQDWTTSDGFGTWQNIQARKAWADVGGLSDVTFWLEVRAVTNPGAGTVLLTYESSPSGDESLFQPLGTVTLTPSSTPVITRVRLVDSAVPPARFVRWKLTGTAAANWSVTFRVYYSAGRSMPGSFDPASLPLSGWWRDFPGASAWSGTASAGHSGDSDRKDLDSPNLPTVGTSLNGHNTADFNGTTSYLASNGNILKYLSTAAYSVAVLFNADTAASAAVAVYDDPAILTDTWPGWSINFSTGGLGIAHYDGAWQTQRVACSTGGYHLGQVVYDGTNVKIRVDANAWTTFAAANLQTTSTFFMRAGINYGSLYFDGRLAEIITSDRTLADDDFDNIRRYINQRYSLSI